MIIKKKNLLEKRRHRVDTASGHISDMGEEVEDIFPKWHRGSDGKIKGEFIHGTLLKHFQKKLFMCL